jgi:hypothetical protein
VPGCLRILGAGGPTICLQIMHSGNLWPICGCTALSLFPGDGFNDAQTTGGQIMVRLMLVLMVATGVCACAPVRSGMANQPGDTSDGFAVCEVACGKRATEFDAPVPVQFDFDALARSAPF